MTEVVGGLQYTRLNSGSVLRELDLFVELIHLPERELFDIGKGSRDQNRGRLTKESLWRSS
jgi:hypothetical protein